MIGVRSWIFYLVILNFVYGEDCCGKCINGVPNFTYNPMDFKQCVENNYCCFHCSDEDIGGPTILPVAGTSFEGTKTISTTGSSIQIQWDKADTITYVSFAPNQEKSGIPLLSSSNATRNGNNFVICPQYPGTLYFRGFGTDICKSVSVEYTINVKSGVDGTTCGMMPTASPDGNTPTTMAPSSHPQCNLARGSIIDGSCVCASDWSGPPECVGQPIWKLLLTIGGGVAAFCSIVVSIRAFLASRKAKREKEANDAAAASLSSSKQVAIEEMETMKMTIPDRQESIPPTEPYHQSKSIDPDDPPSSVPDPLPKEYTL